MKENEITICGHGSNRPSYKNMCDYLQGRQTTLASNGKTKGVVKIMRLKAMNEVGRKKFKAAYAEIIGRNYYNQNLREYCFTAKNGKYYSDCSSSIIKSMEKAGYSFPWTLNTAGIYQSALFEEVPATIVNGHVTNPDVLKVGDCILFRGNDASRPLQIGHVEAVYNVPTTAEKATYPCWVQSGSKWYRRLSEGVNAHGWLNVNGHRYWFDDKGVMATEWQQIDGEWFYFQPNGSLEGALYHTDSRGAQTIMEVGE